MEGRNIYEWKHDCYYFFINHLHKVDSVYSIKRFSIPFRRIVRYSIMMYNIKIYMDKISICLPGTIHTWLEWMYWTNWTSN